MFTKIEFHLVDGWEVSFINIPFLSHAYIITKIEVEQRTYQFTTQSPIKKHIADIYIPVNLTTTVKPIRS